MEDAYTPESVAMRLYEQFALYAPSLMARIKAVHDGV